MVDRSTSQAAIYARNEKRCENILVAITLNKVKNVKD